MCRTRVPQDSLLVRVVKSLDQDAGWLVTLKHFTPTLLLQTSPSTHSLKHPTSGLERAVTISCALALHTESYMRKTKQHLQLYQAEHVVSLHR
jgi:hypothetical protein